MSAWLACLWYNFLFWFAFVLFTFGYSMRVIGRRNIPKSGPVLLISNHHSFIDPPFLGLASRRYLVYLTRSSLFRNRWLGAFIHSVGAVEIDREFGKEGLQTTLKLLERGQAVVVFPEGGRSRDGEIEPFKPGISLLIKRVKAPIVPIGLAGVFQAWSRHQKRPKLAPLFLAANGATLAASIGKPIDPKSLDGLSREEMLAKLFDAVKAEFEKARRLKRK
jgi:1-acyl-sn-glycerol-3-phosphate acyltransferase